MMIEKIKGFFTGWWFLSVVVFFQIVVLFLSPNERTIGSGIKPVYLHVSLTWVGMLFLILGSMLGLVLIFIRKPRLARWHRIMFLSALLFFSAGFIISMYASWVNWGGIPYQEPRIRNAINVVVVGIAAWTLYELVSDYRVQGLASLLPVGFLVLARESDRMVLHPDSPVSSAPLGIKSTFFIMFALAFLLFIWVYQKLFSAGENDH